MIKKISVALAAFAMLFGVFGSVAEAQPAPVGPGLGNEILEVQSWYAALGITGDTGGVNYWANRFDGHNNVGCGTPNVASAAHDMKSFLAASGYMTGSGYEQFKVITAYRLVLGRYPDNNGLNYYVNGLGNGSITWQKMVDNLTYSSEYRTVKVNGGRWDVSC